MLDFLKHYGLPIHISTGGPGIDEIIVLTHWLMLILFVGWGSFFIISLVKFRASKNPKADHEGVKSHLSSVLEVAIAVVEIVLLIGFAFPIWASRVNDVPNSAEDGAVHIRVIAQQYKWNIHYPGDDGVFGKKHVKFVKEDEGNYIGIIEKDALKFVFVFENDTLEYVLDQNNDGTPDWKDDIINQSYLHIPVNKKIRIDLSSKDVIHSFKLPELRVAQDVIPGMIIPVHFEATMTSEEYLEKIKGTARFDSVLKRIPEELLNTDEEFLTKVKRLEKGLQIVCAQLCGLGHYKMKGYLTIHSQKSFNNWLAKNTPSLDYDVDEIEDVLYEWDDDDW